MDLPLIFTLGNSALFASRLFLPVFLVSLSLHYPEFVGMNPPVDHDAWLAKDSTLVILGMLALLESWAHRNPEALEFFREFEGWIKYAGAVTLNCSLIASNGSDSGFTATSLLLTAGASTPALLAYSLRRKIQNILRDADPGNDFGLLSLSQWMEDFWVFIGIILLVFFPILALAGIIIGLLFFWGIGRYFDYKDEKSKVGCESCGELIYQSALICQHCKAENKNPRDIGFLGQPIVEAVSDRAAQKLKLLAVKKCPHCANRLKEKSIQQICNACGLQTLESQSHIEEYSDFIEKRLKDALIRSFIVGFVPVFGAIYCIIYSRLYLVIPHSLYISFGRGMFIRFLSKVCIIFMFIFASVFGMIMCPCITLVYYYSYRSGFKSQYGIP